MDFDNKFSEWGNEGAEPSADLKESGFTAGYKPPASIFNWFWNKVIKSITEIQTKLSKVDNTPDSEKNVAFSSEAGVGRKVKYPFTFRLNGGSTEGTDLWTFDGAVSKSVNLTPDKLGAAKKSEIVPIVTATSTDGATYTATIDGILELYNGLEIVIIPNMTSTKAAVQFDLNGLGAKNVRLKINGYNNGNSGTTAAMAGWIGENVPLAIRYISKFDNWQTVDFSRPSATGLYGTIKPNQGGTGINNTEGITAGNFLVGNGTEEMLEKTPAEVLKILTGKDNISDLVVGGSDWAEWANHPAMHDCSNTNINTLKTSGYYFGYTGMTNAACNEISVIEVIPYSGDWVLQRQTRLTDGKMFVRYLSSGTTWSEWSYIYTSKIGNVAIPASGSYTGNNANDRTIDVGGKGNAVLIISPTSSESWLTFVTPVGSVEIKVGSETSSYLLDETYLDTENMQLVIGEGADGGINKSGKTYHYYVI